MRDDKAKSVVAKQLQDFTVGNGMLDLKTGQISTKRLAGSTCHYIMGFITVVAHIPPFFPGILLSRKPP